MMTEREMKLILRLGEYTAEYLALEREKEIYYLEHTKDMSRTTIVTLYLRQVYIDTLIKKIVRLVDRLRKDDVEFDNEVAILVYDYYAPAMKRGLSDLL